MIAARQEVEVQPRPWQPHPVGSPVGRKTRPVAAGRGGSKVHQVAVAGSQTPSADPVRLPIRLEAAVARQPRPVAVVWRTLMGSVGVVTVSQIVEGSPP